MVDHCVVNWLHNTLARNVFDLIYKPCVSVFTVWSDIEGVFRDNELHRAVHLEAEFRSLKQGGMSLQQYTGRLKKLADEPRTVGQPVSEPSQVLNLLRGLSPKYRHVKLIISSKSPPHNFRSACSFLLLEKVQLQNDEKEEADQSLSTVLMGLRGQKAALGMTRCGRRRTRQPLEAWSFECCSLRPTP
ncbi:unnamed protein product [Urochloa humidicola]